MDSYEHSDTEDDKDDVTNSYTTTDPDAERQTNQIIYAGRQIATDRIVETKYSKGRFSNAHRKKIMDDAWFTGVKRICVGKAHTDGTVSAEMLDITAMLQRYEERHQDRLKLLYGLLSRLMAEVSRDKPRSYILLPHKSGRDFRLRTWDLYEVAEGDSLLRTFLEDFHAKFPARDTHTV